MNERELTRLSFLFSSVAATPRLAHRFVQGVLDRGGEGTLVFVLRATKGLLPPEPETRDLVFVRDILERGDNEDLKTAGRILGMAIENAATPCMSADSQEKA